MVRMDRNWWMRDLGWLFASAGTLLAVTAGLLLFARFEGNNAGLATTILTLYIASWSAVIAGVVTVTFLFWWLVGTWRHRTRPTALREAA